MDVSPGCCTSRPWLLWKIFSKTTAWPITDSSVVGGTGCCTTSVHTYQHRPALVISLRLSLPKSSLRRTIIYTYVTRVSVPMYTCPPCPPCSSRRSTFELTRRCFVPGGGSVADRQDVSVSESQRPRSLSPRFSCDEASTVGARSPWTTVARLKACGF